ncbi:MAG: VWA domain-containing protein, partial [Trebonia sp.]
MILLASFIPAPAVQAAQTVQVSQTSQTSQGGSGLPLLDVVMLVDESGSETAVSVAQERQVSATIGQSMLNPGSRVTVVGFGGVNHVVPDQNPIDVACNPTVVNSQQNLDYLSTCVNSLHRRSERQGDDTDYAAALGQAMSYFEPNTLYGARSPKGAIKIILMMTDGGVDVHRDKQQYGQDWLQGETQAINEQLAFARQNDVQLWTLGMGTDITAEQEQYLRQLAASGAKSPCGETPSSTLVTNRADAMAALDRLYEYAACGQGIDRAGPVPLPGGSSRTLQVTLPTFASAAAVSVDRGNSAVEVSFYQPNGTLWANSSAISGQASEVEVLHLTSDPMPGTWTMKLTAPPGLQNQLVSATAFYQGAVRALITASPPNAKLGQAITVTLSVLGNNGPITDSALIKNLHVGVTASGDGVAAGTPVTVSNAGENGSSGIGVANYTGTFPAPKTPGSLTFTGTAQGYGLYATDVPETVQVGTNPSFQATVQYPVTPGVQAGSSLHGVIVFTNTVGAAKTVRVTLSTDNAQATLTSPSGTVSVPSGNAPSIPFAITFAKNSPIGSALMTMKVTEAANPATVYAIASQPVMVTKPPGFIAKYLWDMIGAVILIVLIIAAILAERARRRRAADVRKLRAQITHGGDPNGVVREVQPENKWADTFSFVIRDEDNEHARLELPHAGVTEPAYTARRGGRGRVRVTTPSGQQHEIIIGSAGEPLPNGLRLSFRDTGRGGGTRGAGRRGTGTKTPPIPPAPAPVGQPSPAPPN